MTQNRPRVFISYSRHSKEHSAWVLRLAEDLRGNGADAVLDQWDLHPGSDLTRFMVDGITSADSVLLICTPTYAERARAEGGGVAFEHRILSGAIHTGAAGETKFLPILREGEPARSIPHYLQSRLFMDFRDDQDYRHALEGLLRFLFRAPLVGKPELGPPPAFGPVRDLARLSHPVSWVLVAGTGRASAMHDTVRATAERLGQVLASNGYGLVTGGWEGVDEVCARAFARAIQQHQLPLENFLAQVVNQENMPAFAAGRLTFVRPGDAEWEESIDLADIIVLVGGLGGTYETGRRGLDRGKLVLPLADTGTDAKRLFVEMYRQGAPAAHGLTIDQLARLGREAPGVVDGLSDLLREIRAVPRK